MDMTDNRVGLYSKSNRGASITTSSGARFFVFDPHVADIDMRVVAHSLGMMCRYNGHCESFYSVAEHSVMVSRILKDEYGDTRLALIGLLHDAAEAFTGDIVRPIKIAMADAGVDILAIADKKITKAVFDKHNLVPTAAEMSQVKWADNVALATEKRDLHPNATDEWLGLPDPSNYKCHSRMPGPIEQHGSAAREFWFEYQALWHDYRGLRDSDQKAVKV